MTLPGEGRDRVFHVSIKFVAQVSLYALDEALEGKNQQIPLDAVQALDVVMRHLSSMTYVSYLHHFEQWCFKMLSHMLCFRITVEFSIF